jgi:glutaredoxin 3
MGLSLTTPSNPAAMSAAKQFVDSQVRAERVLVFSKTYCPYCTKAKRALAKVLPANKVRMSVVAVGGPRPAPVHPHTYGRCFALRRSP